MKACEHAVFLHYYIGGAQDGYCVPSAHCYETSEVNGVAYKRVSEPVQMESPPDGFKVLNCTDDYMEPVFFRVDMRLAETEEPPQ